MPDPQYDFFISYSHADRTTVGRLARKLAEENVRLWWDRWEMRPGDLLRERINDGIERSRNYILVVSTSSLSSGWVRHELNTALVQAIEDRDVRVIAALGPGVEFEDLPVYRDSSSFGGESGPAGRRAAWCDRCPLADQRHGCRAVPIWMIDAGTRP
jgi:hypothetical protein